MYYNVSHYGSNVVDILYANEDFVKSDLQFLVIVDTRYISTTMCDMMVQILLADLMQMRTV